MKKWILAIISFMLTGCMAPGMHLNVNNDLLPPPGAHTKFVLVRIDHSLMQHREYLVKTKAYRVGPQDVLNIIVWDHPELTMPAGQYRSPADSGIQIDAAGEIYFPFVGTIHVAGLTTDEIRTRLIRGLRGDIRDPQVSVRVAVFGSQKIQVLGEVQKPSTEAITNQPLSLIDALNSAGGLNPDTADTRLIYVIRPRKPYPVIFVLNADDPGALLVAGSFYLRNNDVVYVSTAAVASFGRVLNNIVPSLEAAVYTKTLVN